jgi:hypothetical protein
MTGTLRGLIAVVVVLCPAAAGAQPGTAPTGKECSLLGGYIGAASAEPTESLTAGAAAGWRFSPWVATEARMSWIKRPPGQQALTAGLSALVNLRAGSRAQPFARAGFGLYSASFDLPYNLEAVPAFYRSRLEGDPGGGFQTFNDPAVILGAGVQVMTGRSFSWRPEVETFVVFRDSRAYFVATASVQFSFHFEPHGVTPAARPRR